MKREHIIFDLHVSKSAVTKWETDGGSEVDLNINITSHLMVIFFCTINV